MGVLVTLTIVVFALSDGDHARGSASKLQQSRYEAAAAKDRDSLLLKFARVKRLILRALEEITVPKP